MAPRSAVRAADADPAEVVAEALDPRTVLPGGGGRTPYPTYTVLAANKWRHDWDDKTRRLVLDRVQQVPARSFFSPAEFAMLEAICARLLPQDDRAPQLRIPIAPFIDQRLAHGEGDGYRYEEMPWDEVAYRHGLAAVDETSRALYGDGFAQLGVAEQDTVLAAVEDGDPPGEGWRALPPQRFFRQVVQDALTVYYAHPTAWNEIGFQGPASPRGHIRLALGKRDPWEAEETAPLPPEERQSVEAQPGSAAGAGGATH